MPWARNPACGEGRRPGGPEIGLLLVGTFLIACSRSVGPPPRLPGVPAAAVWAGGVDGGNWFDCHQLAGSELSFECAIYNDQTGTLYARGRFLPSQRPPADLTFTAYDGSGRIAMSDTSWLMAQDTVDFPFGDGHGKRSVFSSGKEVGPEIQY